MKKKIISLLIVSIVSLSLIGCGGDNRKIVNDSILVNSKITNLEHYVGVWYRISTDQGDFVINGGDYYDQLNDLFNLSKNTNKDLMVDIIYNNIGTLDGLHIAENVVIL